MEYFYCPVCALGLLGTSLDLKVVLLQYHHCFEYAFGLPYKALEHEYALLKYSCFPS